MSKVASKGTVLQLDIAATDTTIAQVISIDGPSAEVETYDATTLDTVGAGKEFEPTGYADGGEITFELFFDPVAATHQALTDLVTTPEVKAWTLIFADGANTEWPFNGILTAVGPAFDMADGVKASCTVKLDGLVTYPT